VKVALCTSDPLVVELIACLLSEREGVQLAYASFAAPSPDGKPGWAAVVSDVDAAVPPAGSRPAWVSGVVVVATAAAGPPGPSALADGTIVVALPCEESALVEALTSASPRPAGPQPPSQSPMVLVVEDSDTQRAIVSGALRAEGFAVVAAEDGVAALAILEAGPVQLVVTDVEMPRMGGLDLTRAIRQSPRTRDLPVLMLTTLSGYEDIRAGFDAGASDYLVKPRKGEREIFLEQVADRSWRLLRKQRSVAVRRALAVDDSRATLQLVAAALSNAGYEVATAGDGSQACEHLSNPAASRPDIIVTDLEMPVMDGLRFTHAVKGNPAWRDIPVVVLSASTVHQHRILSAGFGADAFVSKPFSEEKLLLVVDQVLARSRLERERRELSRIIGTDVLRAVHQGGLTARSKDLTILFSDIAGFSSLCARKTAAEIVDLLNEYFDRFVEFVSREQGYVNKFIGDALMALYAPAPGLDSPEVRAVRTALAFQREMHRINRERCEPLWTRIGINSGSVIMGLIGAGERKDYTVIGDDVNRAQRLEGACPVGGVLVSEATMRAAHPYVSAQADVSVERREALKLKGIGEPVSAHAITFKE